MTGMDRKIKKKVWTAKRIAVTSAAGLFVIVVLYNILFGDHSAKLNVQTERLTISTVHRGEFQEFIPITGTVVPDRTVYLDAIEGGVVDTVFLEAGVYVERGDPILKLANTNLVMDIMYREAELVQQSNNLRNTRLAMEQNSLALRAQILELDYQIKSQKRMLDNYEHLSERGWTASQELEEARDHYEYLVADRDLTIQRHHQDSVYREEQLRQLQASLERMELNLEIVKQNLDNLTIKAPVSGLLTSLNAEVGESKGRGERLGQIDIEDAFKLRAAVDEHYISRVSYGQQAEFTFAERTYPLVVRKVYPEVINGRFEVDMEFDGGIPEELRRGQTFRVRLELGDLSEALLLARGGFFQKTGGRWVFVVDGDMARKRDIQLGQQNPLFYEILEGLQEGERVITSSYDNFGDVDRLVLK